MHGPPPARRPHGPTPLAPRRAEGPRRLAAGRRPGLDRASHGPREPSPRARPPPPDPRASATLSDPSSQAPDSLRPRAPRAQDSASARPAPGSGAAGGAGPAPRGRPRPRRPPYLARAEIQTRGAVRFALPPRRLPGPAGSPRSPRPAHRSRRQLGPVRRGADTGPRAIGARGRPSPCRGPPPRSRLLPAEAWAGGARARAAPIVAVSWGRGGGPWRRRRDRRGGRGALDPGPRAGAPAERETGCRRVAVSAGRQVPRRRGDGHGGGGEGILGRQGRAGFAALRGTRCGGRGARGTSRASWRRVWRTTRGLEQGPRPGSPNPAR